MIGEKGDGKNILVLIEWKHTETYDSKNLYISERYNNYDPLLREENCPLNVDDFGKLYYEPYYQLMRQVLLGWKMVEAHEYNCDEYIHLHIIPSGNPELRSTITSPRLAEENMSDAWKKALVNPERYKVLSPDELFKPLEREKDVQSLLIYLKKRYWE
jgi:hypothetical protein